LSPAFILAREFPDQLCLHTRQQLQPPCLAATFTTFALSFASLLSSSRSALVIFD
jgi:hypothetical protein